MSKPYSSSILITGGTQGLGYACALNLAHECPSSLIVIASRKDPDDAATGINTTLQQENVKFMPLDLSSLDKVRDFAHRWNAENNPPIQALILNAGLQLPGDVEYTADGMEMHFGVNHVGHALLFHLLLPVLTSDARIVVVASGVHDPASGWGLEPAYTTPDEVACPSESALKKSNGRSRYATSKVANVLWAVALGRHMAGVSSHASKTVVAFDPGLMVGTQFTRNAGWLLRFLNSPWLASRLVPLARFLFKDNINTGAESGENMAWLAVGGEVHGKKGAYFEKRKEVPVSEQARSEELQEDLWRWTIEKVAVGRTEREGFEKLA